MYDLVGVGKTRADINPPLLRGRSFQHGAGDSSRRSHRLEKEPDAIGSICVLVTQILVPFGLHDVDLFPVGFQFVCQLPRQAGADARSHFRSMCQDVNPSVGVDGDKQIGAKDSTSTRFGSAKAGVADPLPISSSEPAAVPARKWRRDKVHRSWRGTGRLR